VGLGVAGSPDSAIEWADLARTARERGSGTLSAEMDFMQGEPTYPFGAHLAIVEVDTETGWARLLAHTAVDDCGSIVNPMLLKGQQHGGIAQGAGQALWEHARFDHNGYPLTPNLVTYHIPVATDLPSFRVSNTITPTRHNPLGAKGAGEAGTIGSTPAIHSAVMDALAPWGVRHLDMPLTPDKIWEAINAAG
jgi:carbon-monoxide dehydrogenase large subunit